MKNSKRMQLFQIRNRKKLIICAVISIAWIIIMLTLSSQNGTQTAQVSGSLSEWLARLIYGDSATVENICAVHNFTRKAAHVFLFSVLSALLAEIIDSFENAKLIFCAAASVCMASLFAFADEWHKLFISGRHFDMFDVMLNIVGALLGAAVFFAIHYLYQKRNCADK